MSENIHYGSDQNIRIKLADMINLAENPLKIILEIAKMLGENSGEDSYYRNIYEQILAVYGFALDDKFILEKELAEVEERLKKIHASYENPHFTEEEHKRMSFAVERHNLEIARLKSFISSV